MKLRDVLSLSSCVRETIVVDAATWIIRDFDEDWHETNKMLEPYMDRNVYSIGVWERDNSLFICLEDEEGE